MKKEMKHIAAEIDLEMLAKLETVCEKEQRSLSSMLRIIIADWLKGHFND